MAKKQAGENSKKASGNAKVFSTKLPAVLNVDDKLIDSFKKAEAANQKAAAENAKKAVAEDQEWSKGAKSNAKKFVLSCPYST